MSSDAVEPMMQSIAGNVRRHPLRRSVSCGQVGWSYRRLWDESTAVLLAVQSAGAGVGSRIVLGVPPGAGWVAGLLGIWRAGGVAVLANVEHPPARLSKVADAAEYVFAGGESTERTWPGRLRRIAIAGTATPRVWDMEPSAHAVVLHTSGSSGDPKPVLLGHAGLADRIARFQSLYGITSSDRIAQLAAPSVDVILWEVLLALVSGARVEVPVGTDRIPGRQLVEWLSRRKISVLACTPTMLAALPEVDLPALRLIVLGGEPVYPARHRFWIERHQVANAYGPTEATIATHVCPRIPVDGPAPIGRPVPGVGEYLLDDEQQPVADGEIGNLYVGGTGLAVGYSGLPGLTASVFPTLIVNGRPQPVYRTGDRVYRRADGQLVFVGRADRQLNLGGYRLEPGEVEAVATAHPGVIAAVAVTDGEPGQQVLVLHVAVPTGNVTSSQLRHHLADLLPAPAVPARIHLWPQLPLTDSGKSDLPALARPGRRPVHASLTTASIGLPEQVVRWWTEAAGTPPADGTDFFDSGGHSLGAVRLLHQVNEAYGSRIAITAFVADPTPEHLARALAEVMSR